MSVAFGQLREFEGKRVRVGFDDGVELVGRLLSAVEDSDGSQHVIYEDVEWASDPREFMTRQDATLYAEGESIVSIVPAEARTESEAKNSAARVASVIELAGQVFGDRTKATLWLTSQDGTLMQPTPMSMLDTEAGVCMVESLLRGIDEGVYT